MLALQRAGRIMNRGANADVRGAATDIAIHGEIDVAVGRFLPFAQKSDRAHYLSGLAVAALRNIARDPGALHRLRFPSRDPFNGRHLAGTDRRHRQ